MIGVLQIGIMCSKTENQWLAERKTTSARYFNSMTNRFELKKE